MAGSSTSLEADQYINSKFQIGSLSSIQPCDELSSLVLFEASGGFLPVTQKNMGRGQVGGNGALQLSDLRGPWGDDQAVLRCPVGFVRINGLFHLLIDGVYIGVIAHWILTFDGNFLGHRSMVDFGLSACPPFPVIHLGKLRWIQTKMDHFKRKCVFQPAIFREYNIIVFRGVVANESMEFPGSLNRWDR